MNAKLNVSKPRDDSILYPDEKAPFHVPDTNPGFRTFDPAVVCILKNHCVYSLAVLLWLLMEDKYCRPDYAETSDVKQVYAAIAQGRDSKNILRRLEKGDLTSGGRIEGLNIVQSTFNLPKEESLSSWLENFKVKVTSVLSTYETMETRV